jgi:hypothetical protein
VLDVTILLNIKDSLSHRDAFLQVMEEPRLEHTSEQWTNFFDSSKVNLKAGLLHKGNKFPSIPLAGAGHVTET